MRALSLYTGIGGMDLGAIAAGMDVVAHCEIDDYCRAVLRHYWPEVPCYASDELVCRERVERDGLGPIDIIIGGPPCQAVSLAGKRLGPADPRFRWPEALRIISDLRPRWVVWENPAGLFSAHQGRPFGAICRQMAEMGYCVGWGSWGAADLGAPHRRERIFIIGRLGHASRLGHEDQSEGAHCEALGRAQPGAANRVGERGAAQGVARRGGVNARGATPLGHADDQRRGRWSGEQWAAGWPEPADAGSGVGQADACRTRREGAGSAQQARRRGLTVLSGGGGEGTCSLGPQPPLDIATYGLALELARHPVFPAPPGAQHDWEQPRVLSGRLANRSRMLMAIGNACVPAQGYALFAAIMEEDQ